MPPESSLPAVLSRVIRRAWIADALLAAAAGIGAVAVISLGGRAAGVIVLAVAAGAVAAGAVLWRGRGRRTRAGAATLLEAARPECRNVVVTAAELMAHPERASGWMRARVFADADAHARIIPAAVAVPLRRPVAALLVAAVLAVAIASGVQRTAIDAIRHPDRISVPANAARSSGPLRIVAAITPPPYTGVPPREEADPHRIDVVQGSRVQLRVSGLSSEWRIRFGTQPVAVTHSAGQTIADAVLTDSGYFAIEQLAGPAGSGRLLPVSVTPDRAPVITIDTPGKDLLLPDARPRVPLTASVSDDYGLQSFELRYTKVSGTGEQFEFEEGVLPLSVSRDGDRRWTASAQIALTSLKLEPGDAIVYHAVARDRRPGDAGLATSDTYFIEIAGPGQVALEGFELPPDRERYALSQQMIVLKIQRLQARERTLTRQAVEEETAAIAAEQRSVRANFIFLMGGTVEDEEVEAEQSSEIQEGRLQNSARREITAAVSHMTRAEQGLAAASTSAALPPAKAAVEALQRAFGRSRYFLRTLPVRSRVDPSRRLTGELATASDWRRELIPASEDPETRAAGALLSRLLDLAEQLQAGRRVAPDSIAALAEQALAIDPGSAAWQQVAQRLGDVREAIDKGEPRAAIARTNEAVAPVLEKARGVARRAPDEGTARPGALLRAWATERRR